MVHILCASPFHKHLPNEQHIFNTRIILVKISRNVAYPYWMLLKGLFSMKFTDTFAKLKFWRCSLRRLQAGTKMCPPQMMFALFFFHLQMLNWFLKYFACWDNKGSVTNNASIDFFLFQMSKLTKKGSATCDLWFSFEFIIYSFISSFKCFCRLGQKRVCHTWSTADSGDIRTSATIMSSSTF